MDNSRIVWQRSLRRVIVVHQLHSQATLVSVLVSVRFVIQCSFQRRDALGPTVKPLRLQDNTFWCAWVHKHPRRLRVSCSAPASATSRECRWWLFWWLFVLSFPAAWCTFLRQRNLYIIDSVTRCNSVQSPAPSREGFLIRGLQVRFLPRLPP